MSTTDFRTNIIKGVCKINKYQSKDKVILKCDDFTSTRMASEYPKVEELILRMAKEGFGLKVDEKKLVHQWFVARRLAS